MNPALQIEEPLFQAVVFLNRQSIARRAAWSIALALSLVTSATAADWPMLGRDATRNPVSPEQNPPTEWNLTTGRNVRWKARIGSMAFAEPVVSGGMVWIGSNNRHSWDASLTPIFANGILYLATESGLHAIAKDSQASRHDWPQWRGPDRSNASRETGLLQQWPTNGPPLLWTLTGLGEGITAMAVADGQAYTLGYRDEAEFLFCLDAESGDTRWISRIGSASDTNQVYMHGLMRWLSPRVPTVDDDRIYAISATGELSCLRTADGGLLWGKSYPNDFLSNRRHWGFCDYPLVDGDQLICVPGGPTIKVVALNKRTGELIWQTVLPGEAWKAHAATVLSTAAGIRHYVVFLHDGLAGIAANDGRVLWRYPKTVGSYGNAYTPIISGDLVFSANGYGGGMALLHLRPTTDGIVADEQYRHPFKFDVFQDSTVMVQDHVYAFRGPGQAVCIELATGHLAWEAPDIASTRRSALTYADGCLYVRRSDGSLSLLEATPRAYAEKGSFVIPNPEEVSGVTFPVVANGRLYLRDNNRLLCYNVRDDALTHPNREPGELAVNLSLLPAKPDRVKLAPPRTGVNRAPDAIFVPTPDDVVTKMLGLAELTPDSVLFDLGSGDGRIVIEAARQYGCQAVGYEIDASLVELARDNVRSNNLEHLVRIEHADLFTVDLSDAHAIMVYLPSPLLERLRPQFDQLKPGARIVSHQFAIPGIAPDHRLNFVSTDDGDRHQLFMWKAPLTAPLP